MKVRHYLYILSAFAVTAACSDEAVPAAPAFTVGEADNAIVLKAGITEGGTGASTRAEIAEDHHANPGHKVFSENTKLRLKVDGTWLGRANGTAPHGTVSGTLVSQSTTATIGEGIKVGEETSASHNKIVFTTDEQLFWDDYGTADPANMPSTEGNGRAKGLTIYGVAVDGVTTAPVVEDWTALLWKVGTVSSGIVDQSTTNYLKNQDLLISNNVKEGTDDGTYKFDNRASGKLLEFKHAMSKITVRLIASDGFPTTGVGGTNIKFKTAPEVKLTSNMTGEANVEWAYTSGSVNVTTGEVSSLSDPAAIIMHEADRTNSSYTVVCDALVMPGSEFKDKATGDGNPYPTIARINADGNIYYVTSEKIREAIASAISSGKHKNEYKTQPGLNYIITVYVKKTKIDVTATIADWVNVESAPVYPVINVNASYGSTDNKLNKESFSFYRSTAMYTGYSSGISLINGYVPSEAVVKKPSSGTEWIFTDGSVAKPLYWTDHSTHYQMRGVWPLTVTVAGDDVTSPHVGTKTIESQEYQVIAVKNVAYEAETFPSDLAIGRPDVDADATCNNSDHEATNLYTVGICATEGTVNLAFEYVMSKVEVNLSTTEGDDKVRLEGAEVEVTNLYTTGDIKLGDRGAIVTGSKSSYSLHPSNPSSTTNQFVDAIVPQVLTYSTDVAQRDNNVRFKITITNTDGTKDIYYADVNPILIKNSTEKIAPNGKWESGKYYVYNLILSKTKIDVTATFKDWVTVTADENVWF